jgi:hypothetical protein
MYTTESKVEQYLQIDIDDSIAAFVVDWINWVSKYIDNYCNTTFESASTTKYYDTHGENRIFIDDCTSITTLEFLDEDGGNYATLTENADFWLYPLNQTTKNEVRLDPYGRHGQFLTGSKRLKITGAFGVAVDVPPDIEMIATQMVGDIVRQAAGEAKGVKSETLGDRSITYDDVQSFSMPYLKTLDHYRCPVL